MSAVEIFLQGLKPDLVSTVEWGRAGLKFEVASYLDATKPPKSLVTSVRGIVSFDGGVVVLENPGGYTFMPGGRVEPREIYEETLRREIWEECGLEVASARELGFLHFRHLNTKPEGYPYPYPYPDQFQIIYVVEGTGTLRSGDTDGYEMYSYVCGPEEALQLALRSLSAASAVFGTRVRW